MTTEKLTVASEFGTSENLTATTKFRYVFKHFSGCYLFLILTN